MKKMIKVLTLSCLIGTLTGVMPVCADVEKSQHPVTLVMAQENYSHIAVSQVTDYVNIREQATTDSKIVGKIYNNCAATILETVSGEGGDWYRIQSGTVNGFIKAQYFITGEEAEKLAQSIGREFVTINTESLRLRERPDLSSNVLTLLSNGARYVVLAEEGDFFQVEVDADLVGYIAKDYCKTTVEFDQAISLEEERQKLAEEAERKRDADTAIAALQQVIQNETNRGDLAAGSGASDSSDIAVNVGELIIAANPEACDNSAKTTAPPLTVVEQQPEASSGSSGNPTVIAGNGNAGNANTGNGNASSGTLSAVSGPGQAAIVSATRTAVVAYAKQFLGNPYVFGGTSLTNGTDCSGFTQGVYKHFGITTGRSSRDQAANGRTIAISAVQPGDLLFYASGDYINHVALYIGDGKVIHASNSTTGIIISPYNYRTPYKAVTFLD